jgi:hypothetical protein
VADTSPRTSDGQLGSQGVTHVKVGYYQKSERRRKILGGRDDYAAEAGGRGRRATPYRRFRRPTTDGAAGQKLGADTGLYCALSAL